MARGRCRRLAVPPGPPQMLRGLIEQGSMQPEETLHDVDLLIRLALGMTFTHRGCTAKSAHAYMLLSGTTSLDAAFGAQSLVYRY